MVSHLMKGWEVEGVELLGACLQEEEEREEEEEEEGDHLLGQLSESKEMNLKMHSFD